MLKESRLGQNTGNFDEAVTSLKAELQMREDEIEKLQVSPSSIIIKLIWNTNILSICFKCNRASCMRFDYNQGVSSN
jgi:hypothetical protein